MQISMLSLNSLSLHISLELARDSGVCVPPNKQGLRSC